MNTRPIPRTITWLSGPLVLSLLLLSGVGLTQVPAATEYRMPPKAIADLVDAPPTPAVSVGPDRQWMLIMERPSLPSISELAQPELRLAGMRINPRTNGPSRASYFNKLSLMKISDGSQKEITGLPVGARIGNVRWSPDGKRIAFTLTRDDGIELWVAEVRNGQARRLGDLRLNAAYGSPYYWLSDSQTLICKIVPADRGPAPKAPMVPTGPVIRENLGKKAPARTYQDLLQNPYDEDLFEYYLTAKVARVTLDGEATLIGRTGMIRRAEPAPNGKLLLVETLHRPFSYLVPARRFPKRVEIWDLDGNVVRQIADLPLAEEVPIGFMAVPTGPRSFGWRADAPATLYWTEAQDGGNPRAKAEVRDRVFLLPAPFDGEPVPLVDLGLRFGGIMWGSDNLALVWERWWRTRNIRTWVVKPGAPGSEPRLLFDRSWEDRYTDPGMPVMRPTAAGTAVLLTKNKGRTLFFIGEGYSPEGNRPFVDERDLATGKTRRLWRSQAPYYERPVVLLDDKAQRLLTRRESKTEWPNYFLRDLRKNSLRQLTDFPDPAPQLAGIQKELIRYKRADGVDLSATLYLPAGYSPDDGPLPMLMWAYPREFKSAAAASQVTDSPYRYVRIRWASPLFWLTQGYAVLDGPTMPIVGEGDKEPNDTYVEQLVASAQAAVDEVVRRGVADRDRIAIGGHSYGAFMAANLLAHSDLFRAGIARSGAYNRTLTPFGFQAEERTLWEAPEIYFKMSPFMHADKVNEPILLIHGEADNNSGTFPLQSRRFYHALKGLGATARLVMLPHESHGYRARESVMHTLWEMTEWLDKYVKNAGPRRTTAVKGGR
jgi:dipeptidyl aminopeptidase/acylaminoacyl peptidase